jgi:hypothetical protein
MLWAVTGQVKFYDEPTAWGLILGDDGGLYVVRGNRLPGPPLRIVSRCGSSRGRRRAVSAPLPCAG